MQFPSVPSRVRGPQRWQEARAGLPESGHPSKALSALTCEVWCLRRKAQRAGASVVCSRDMEGSECRREEGKPGDAMGRGQDGAVSRQPSL